VRSKAALLGTVYCAKRPGSSTEHGCALLSGSGLFSG
jgi:hypothetical protein